jgi:hypothetical protein
VVLSVVGGMARVWYRPMTATAALLLRRRRPIGEPHDLVPRSTPAFGLIRGPAGAGRALHALATLGRPFDDVVQSTHDPDVDSAAIDRLDLGERFPTVIAGSHLVNTPDTERRQAWLRAAARHVMAAGDVLVEHHPVDWAETAEDEPAVPGGSLGMVDVRRDPPCVSAVSVFDAGGRVAHQPFTARVLSDAELESELRASGLDLRERLSPTWLLAGLRPRAR